ncbi:ComF family protein [Bdellovibrio sp. NC01]|uniref:ComF family protein n=1 Tax=Bdellovibrio sp. NC01 TaxID=2220073 RepID=UPI001159C12B|nr:ComF family protein [Bdellovibrio sp. NC01]QDK39506.1 hypothetical protein DOE51_18840 [Bdellovibrio sp. NC01]
MKMMWQLLQAYFFPCLYCGSLQGTKALLCERCARQLEYYEHEQGLFHYNEAPYPIFALYEWNPGQSDLLSSTVLALKQGQRREAWNHYAQKFSQKRMALNMTPSKKIRFVPAPSSSGHKDHAFAHAEALAKHFSGEVVPCLKKLKKKSQRGGNRQQRQRLRLGLDEKYSEVSKDSTDTLWVFVDDILTTGSTAHAAYEVLGSPTHFEVWVLGRRSLSCGASRYLL